MNIFETLTTPIISEKAIVLKDKQGKYTFRVHTKATKQDVREAVEKLFDVSVVKVSTSITRGKFKRRGMRSFLEASKKKAIVTLAKGQTLSLFDEQ